MTSNQEDETTLTLLFKKVKICCPEARIETFMTDDGMYQMACGLITGADLDILEGGFQW